MARMIPPKIHPEVKSAAERRVFDWIRDAQGTEDWICLHSLGLSEHESKRRAEIDFLLLTRIGVFVLEVKGGRVARENGVWKFTNRYGKTDTKSEGPFDQASGAMFGLEKRVREKFDSGDRRQHRLLYGFGVITPDCPLADMLGTEADRRQLYDRDSFKTANQSIKTFIEELAQYWRERSSLGDNPGRYAPTEKDLELLSAFLRGDFDRVPSMGAIADAATHQMHALESEQYQVLDALEKYPNPRLIVQGGAGTGKTLLAAEISRREANTTDGDVLLLCFNRVLAGVLRKNVTSRGRGTVVVNSIHAVLHALIEGSEVEAEFEASKAGLDHAEIFNRLMPEFALHALMTKNCPQYKSLVIDEAQDMLSRPMLDVLDALVVGGLKNGRWWFFCDRNNQASVFGVYEDEALFLLIPIGVAVLLPTNRRNTIQIATETEIKTLPQFPPAATVDGIPVKTDWYKKPADQRQLLSTTLKKLLNEEISPHQISVLSCRKAEDSCASQFRDFQLATIDEGNAWKVGSKLLNQVTACSVSSFKGLENDFIILTDVDELSPDWWRGVVYVGMSRARIGLYVFINQKLEPLCDERQRDWLRKQVTE
ncbi:Nuclease-related domain protein [Rosistilla carotiformis]|uniref:Nuclease-related domain protein n=1 Tax=Rosistilla carotiformis TaxID=2528017 RepID=A0A518JRD6_9BACT|nr:NERD domain-containing protein [Rosistilla carotiformis]QDV68101.1 Nuclease-related domain protein [Rosistilla carotiformis]